MTIILYSDKNFEKQALLTIASLKNKLNKDIKFIYYTIGFKSDVKLRNLKTHYIEINPDYPLYNFYKMDLCLKTIELYNDDYYFYTDVDIIFSKKVDFDKLKFDFDYPMASYGPVEFPTIFMQVDGKVETFTEKLLMENYGVKNRSMPYVWNCIFTFNNKCKSFFQEVTDMFKNKKMISDYKRYFPYSDETAFNVCLWKRGVNNNLDQAFLNTHSVDNLIKTEENNLINYGFGSFDCNGFDWQRVKDSKNIIAYHGFKNVEDMQKAVDYITEKNLIIIGCFVTNKYKKKILIDFINQAKKTGCHIMLVSHLSVDEEILNLVDYYVYDKDNEKLPVENCPTVWFADDIEFINIHSSTHGIAIVKNLYNGLNLAKSLNYKHFIYTEYDYILDDRDIYNLASLFTRLNKENKKLFLFTTPSGDGYMSAIHQTQMLAGNVSYFLQNIKLPYTYEDWIYNNLGNHSLEKALTLISEPFLKDAICAVPVSTFLPNSNTDVFSVFDSDIIAYNSDDPLQPILFMIPKSGHVIYKLIINNEIIINKKLNNIFKYKLNLNEKENFEIQLFMNDVEITHLNVNKNNIDFYKNKAVKKNFNKL